MEDDWANWGKDVSKLRTEDEEVKREQPTHQFHPAHIAAASQSNTLPFFTSAHSPSYRNPYNDSRNSNGQHPKSSNGSMNGSSYSNGHKQSNPSFQQSRSYQSIQPVGRQQSPVHPTSLAKQTPILLGYGEPSSVREARLAQATPADKPTTMNTPPSPHSVQPSTRSSRNSIGHPHQVEQNPSTSGAVNSTSSPANVQSLHAKHIEAKSLAGREVLPSSVSQGKSSDLSKTIPSATDASSDIVVRVHRNSIPPSVSNKIISSKQITVPVSPSSSSPRDQHVSISTSIPQLHTTQESSKPDMNEPLVLHLSPTFPMDSIKKLKKQAFHIQTRMGSEGLSIKLYIAPEAVNNAYEASLESHVIFKGGRAEEGLLSIIDWITEETEELYLPIDTHTRQIYENLRPNRPSNFSEKQKESDTSLEPITIYIPPSFPFNKAAELEDFVFELIEEPEFEDLDRILNIPKGSEEEPGKWSVVLEGRGNRKAGKLVEIWVEEQIQQCEKPTETMKKEQEKAISGEDGLNGNAFGFETAHEQEKEEDKVQVEKAPTPAGELLALLNLPEKQSANGSTSQKESPIPTSDTFAVPQANSAETSAYPTTVPSGNRAIWQEWAAPPVVSSGWLRTVPLEAQPYQTTHNRMLSNGSLARPSTAGISNSHSDGHMSIDAPLQYLGVNSRLPTESEAPLPTPEPLPLLSLRLPMHSDLVKFFRGPDCSNFRLLEELIPLQSCIYDATEQNMIMESSSAEDLELGRRVMAIFLNMNHWNETFPEEVYRLGPCEERVLRDVLSQKEEIHQVKKAADRFKWVIRALKEGIEKDKKSRYHEAAFRLPPDVLAHIRGEKGCRGLDDVEKSMPIQYAIIREDFLILQDIDISKVQFGRRVLSILARLFDSQTNFQQEQLKVEIGDEVMLQVLRDKKHSQLFAGDRRLGTKIRKIVELLKSGQVSNTHPTAFDRSASPDNKRAMSPSVFSSPKVSMPTLPPSAFPEAVIASGWQPIAADVVPPELISKAELSDRHSHSTRAILPPFVGHSQVPQVYPPAQKEHNPKEILANIARWSTLTTPTNSVRWSMYPVRGRSRLLGFRRANFNAIARLTGVVAIFIASENYQSNGPYEIVVLASENPHLSPVERQNLLLALKAIKAVCRLFNADQAAFSQDNLHPSLHVQVQDLLEDLDPRILQQTYQRMMALPPAEEEKCICDLIASIVCVDDKAGEGSNDIEVKAALHDAAFVDHRPEYSQQTLLAMTGPGNSVQWELPSGSLRARLIGGGRRNLEMIRRATGVTAIFPHPTLRHQDDSRAMFILASDSQALNASESDRLVLALKAVTASCALFNRRDCAPSQRDVPAALGIKMESLLDAVDEDTIMTLNRSIAERGGEQRRTTDADIDHLVNSVVARHKQSASETAHATQHLAEQSVTPLHKIDILAVYRAANRNNSMRWNLQDGIVRTRLIGKEGVNLAMIASLTGTAIVLEPGRNWEGRSRSLYIVGSLGNHLDQQAKDNIRKALKAVVAIFQLFGRQEEMGPLPDDMPAFLDMTRATILNEAESRLVRAKEEELHKREGGIASNTDVDLRQLVVGVLEIAGSPTIEQEGHHSLEIPHLAKSDATRLKLEEWTPWSESQHPVSTSLSQLLGIYLAPVYLSSAEEAVWCDRDLDDADCHYIDKDQMASLGSAFWACHKMLELGKSLGLDLSALNYCNSALPHKVTLEKAGLVTSRMGRIDNGKAASFDGIHNGRNSDTVELAASDSASQRAYKDEGYEIDTMEVEEAEDHPHVGDWERAAEEEEIRQAVTSNVVNWRGKINASPDTFTMATPDIPARTASSPVANLTQMPSAQAGSGIAFGLPINSSVRLAVIGHGEENLRAIERRTQAIICLHDERGDRRAFDAQIDTRPLLVSGPAGAVKQALKELRSILKAQHPNWRIGGEAGQLLQQYDMEEKLEASKAVNGSLRTAPKVWTPNLIVFVPSECIPSISAANFTSIGVGISIDKVMLGKVAISSSSADHTEVALRLLRDLVRQIEPNWMPEGEAEKLVKDMDREDEKIGLRATGQTMSKQKADRAPDRVESEAAPDVVGWYDNESKPNLPVGHGWAQAAPFIPEAERLNGHLNERAGGRSWDNPRSGDQKNSGRTDHKPIY